MRKEATFTAEDGRDKGKIFKLTEMPAMKAEKWALRALSAAARHGVDIGHIESGGMASLALVGIQAIVAVPFEEAEPLLDELFECVQIVRDPRHPNTSFKILDEDIEEVITRLKIRREVVKLHVDFSAPAVLSKSDKQSDQAAGTSSTTSTSRPSLGQQSQRVSRRSTNSKPSTR